LRKLGMSQAAIAECVGVSSSTVSTWLAVGAYPETTRGPYVSRIDPYLPSLFQRWESGCHNMVLLHQEIVARGYKGSYASVRDHLIRRLPGGKKNTCKGAQLSPVPLPVRQVMFLFLRRPLRLGSRGARDHSSTPPKPSRIGPDVYSRAGVCQNAAHTHRGKP